MIAEEVLSHVQTCGWQPVDQSSQERVIPGLGRVFGCGAAVRKGEQIAFGSAADERDFPWARAGFELLERTLLYDARDGSSPCLSYDLVRGGAQAHDHGSIFPTSPQPDRWQYSLSNGVALHRDWQLACHNALNELVERHQVLSTWRRREPVLPVAGHPLVQKLAGLNAFYRVVALRMGADRIVNDEILVTTAGIFLFPRTPEKLMVYGFGSGPCLDMAMEKAYRETLQRLNFLWEENAPGGEPKFAPTSSYHQSFYLRNRNQPLLEDWLAQTGRDETTCRLGVRFVDLTPDDLRGFHLVKAISADAEPLTFGRVAPGEEAPHPIV